MLPNLRLVPVGGVFIAIVVLVLNLALERPGAPPEAVAQIDPRARGALMASADHPEWRQFLVLAAFQRAGELERLRALPDSPPPLPKAKDDDGLRIAALANKRSDLDPDDVTGSIAANPSMALPVDIGEASSTELPITAMPDQPPVIKTPQREKSTHQSPRKAAHRAQAKLPAKPAEPDPFGALFGNKTGQPQAHPAR